MSTMSYENYLKMMKVCYYHKILTSERNEMKNIVLKKARTMSRKLFREVDFSPPKKYTFIGEGMEDKDKEYKAGLNSYNLEDVVEIEWMNEMGTSKQIDGLLIMLEGL